MNIQSQIFNRYVILAWARIVLFVAALLIAIGCERIDGPQPPEIVFGQSECDVCRMIISDERFAAGLVIDQGGAEYRSLAFDDIGCMLEYEQSNAGDVVAARFVRDRDTRQWLDALTAVYLHSKSLETPMAFGVGAFAERPRAEALRPEHAGDVCDFAEIQRRFQSRQLRHDPFHDEGSES